IATALAARIRHHVAATPSRASASSHPDSARPTTAPQLDHVRLAALGQACATEFVQGAVSPGILGSSLDSPSAMPSDSTQTVYVPLSALGAIDGDDGVDQSAETSDTAGGGTSSLSWG